jgi:glutamate synthase (NADPH/NADH) small chain
MCAGWRGCKMAKRNMNPQKTPIPEQDANIRNKNFDEVALGYTEEMAKSEAKRCLQCKHRPCVGGCPVNVQIPDFIGAIAEGRFKDAYEIIKETNSLPAVCGRVCPQETQCEKLCVRAIKGESVGIGRLERFAADWYMKNIEEKVEKPKSNGRKVAVIGSGPAGLTCAGDLAKLGYDVTIFEAFHVAGGVLMYGIPQFRLPKEIVQKEIDALKQMGVTIETNSVVGKVVSIDELMCEEGFEAVFVGTGAGLPSFMKIPGENLNGVYSSNEFLTRVNLMKAYKFPEYETPVKIGRNVAVIGGGNVAMDAARCAKRLGAENVYIIYRRSEAEMPARLEEVHHAKEEGIIFKVLTNPTRILGKDGWVAGIECVEMELGEPDESGRRKPRAKEGSEFVMDMDTVIIAIGQSPNPLIKSTTPDLKTHSWGGIIVDEETGKTSKEGVFAGGDAVSGAATVILAAGAGKKAAKAIDEYLKSKQ